MVCTKCEKKLGKLVSPPPPPFSVAIPVILRALSDIGFSLTTCESRCLARWWTEQHSVRQGWWPGNWPEHVAEAQESTGSGQSIPVEVQDL
mmetsp:Transcript_161387/g.518164  ORF Transcript_161387/g.518164 Transcript_161387/m.518164 type:complete len:91 (-) Transcript_161387:194-466(-)